MKPLKLTVLVEDSAAPRRRESSLLEADHGLSVHVQVETEKEALCFLIDTGPSSGVVLHNAEALRLDLTKTKAILLSHGHDDHTGGLIHVLKHISKKVLVIAHPRLLEPKLKLEPCLRSIGLPFTASEIAANGGILLLSRTAVPLMRNVSTTGEIERATV